MRACRSVSLNAPFGARCFLTRICFATISWALSVLMHLWRSMLSDVGLFVSRLRRGRGLKAPFGARCFLTSPMVISTPRTSRSLNAPYGAHLGGLFENVACNCAFAPSRLEAASLRCQGFCRSLKFERRELHAKFLGACCFLTDTRTAPHTS